MTTTAGGRRLLEHCFTQFGATSETGHEDANHTHSGASDWEAAEGDPRPQGLFGGGR